ncbi:MAG: Ascorbate-specific permease IIC component UlaA [Firmicutes bacterium ADurb.Bin182]|nr:MAG: Ascorbate-specific permease IIC component UlaA [Firmicutes bacterium ADurb.Bin182]
MGVLNFIVTEIFGQGAIFLALIAMIGLIIQKKSLGEIVRGTVMTAIGFFVLNRGVGIVAEVVSGLSSAFTAVMPKAQPTTTVDIGGMYGTQIGIVMVIAFVINLLVARFTKWKSIFLTGHMLYWFPFVFIAAGVDAGMSGIGLIVLATVFTALYMVVSPNLMRPLVREATGDDSFTIGHPTTILSVLAGYLGKVVGNKEKSAEEIKLPKGLSFLRDISITGSIVILITYIVMAFVLQANGLVPGEIWGYTPETVFSFYFTRAMTFGVGITVLLLGVRMLIAEIVPAFKGIADKVIPGAIPALDCPVIFNVAPNALMIGFITALITSTLAILITLPLGIFPTVVIPLVFTCFFEAGTAAIIANATGGIRGCIIGSAINGILMVFLVGLGAYFYSNTINDWMLVFGGQDFSFWGIIEGLVTKIFA